MTTERKGLQNFGPIQETDLKEYALPPSRVFIHRDFNFFVDESRVVLKDGTSHDFKNSDKLVFMILCANPNRAMGREDMLRNILDLDDSIPVGTSRTIDVHISSIRKIIGDVNLKKPIIETVYGIGYKLNDEDRTPTYAFVELASSESRIEVVYRHPDFELYSESMVLQRVQNQIKLTTPEGKLAVFLATNINQILSHAQIVESAGYDRCVPTKIAANELISSLRKKFAKIGIDGKRVIRTVPYVGYMLVDETTSADS